MRKLLGLIILLAVLVVSLATVVEVAMASTGDGIDDVPPVCLIAPKLKKCR